MAPYLLSFLLNDDGNDYSLYGSTVMQLDGEPTTAETYIDIQLSLAMEAGVDNAVLVSWDLLSGKQDHPSHTGPYRYFVTFYGFIGDEIYPGSIAISRHRPLRDEKNLRRSEEAIATILGFDDVKLIRCRPLASKESRLEELVYEIDDDE